MIIMISLVLLSMGLRKIYIKYFLKKSNSTIVFLSKDEFEKKLKEDLLNKSKKENEDKNGN
ncbi:MAG: hypothetical protein E7Z87_04535 [Cyanobacteria bacterium SIG26]|nr:hypothetical protein [Cyanobacteria bacterium SIG26]